MTEARDSVEEAYFQSLLELFSVVMVLDRKLKVVFASETLLRYLPELAESPDFLQKFTLIRPRALRNYDDFVRRLDSLYLLTSANEDFAVRGQFIHGTERNRDYLVFCGAPWLHWLNTNRPEIKLGLKDFSHQDVQLDQCRPRKRLIRPRRRAMPFSPR